MLWLIPATDLRHSIQFPGVTVQQQQQQFINRAFLNHERYCELVALSLCVA